MHNAVAVNFLADLPHVMHMCTGHSISQIQKNVSCCSCQSLHGGVITSAAEVVKTVADVCALQKLRGLRHDSSCFQHVLVQCNQEQRSTRGWYAGLLKELDLMIAQPQGCCTYNEAGWDVAIFHVQRFQCHIVPPKEDKGELVLFTQPSRSSLPL